MLDGHIKLAEIKYGHINIAVIKYCHINLSVIKYGHANSDEGVIILLKNLITMDL